MSLSTSYPTSLDINRQASPKAGTASSNSTAIYSDSIWLNEKFKFNNIKTLYDLFQNALKHGPNKNFLGFRPYNSTKGKYETYYQYYTYEEIAKRRDNLGSGISKLIDDGKLGNIEQCGWKAGTWSKNCVEWQVADLSLHAFSRISVPLYDTLGNDSVEYVINHSEINLVFTSSSHLPQLYKLMSVCPTVKAIIVLDGLHEPGAPLNDNREPGQLNRSEIFKKWAQDVNVNIYSLSEIEELGSLNPHSHIPPKPTDTFTISYTSGTTGKPKGVVHLHSGMTYGVLNLLIGYENHKGNLLASYLPLAHILQRVLEFMAIGTISPIAYTTGDVLRLLEDLQIMQPQTMVTVPRVLNRIYAVIKSQMDTPGVKGSLLKKGINNKLDKFHKTGDPTHIFWDKLIFNKIRQVIGGKIKLIITGSAPIATDVIDTLKVCLCIPIVEGYGSTEGSICVRTLDIDPNAAGFVGPMVPGFEIKLMDVEEMNYFSTDKPFPRGEICIRSKCGMKEYYKDEEKTKESLTSDGFFLSGDIGLIDDLGRLKIIDRKKNIVKLAQGEYIALEKLEGVFALCSSILQIYVHADSLKSYLVAVIVPDLDELKKKYGVSNEHDENIERYIKQDLDEASHKAGLKGFERIKNIHITFDQFTLDNGLLTPTLKVKRNLVGDLYKDVIANLYNDTDNSKL